jgi:hypothetical protein
MLECFTTLVTKSCHRSLAFTYDGGPAKSDSNFGVAADTRLDPPRNSRKPCGPLYSLPISTRIRTMTNTSHDLIIATPKQWMTKQKAVDSSFARFGLMLVGKGRLWVSARAGLRSANSLRRSGPVLIDYLSPDIALLRRFDRTCSKGNRPREGSRTFGLSNSHLKIGLRTNLGQTWCNENDRAWP